MLVVLLFGGDDDAGARGIGELHHDFVAFEIVEEFHEEGAFEADVHRVAFILAGHGFFAGATVVGIAGGEDDAAGLDVELHEGAAGVGENEHAAQGGDHRRAVERDEVGVVLGNDAVVVGELALDQAAGEVVALRGDDGVATVEADGDVAHFFLQDVAHDVGRLLVEDERGGGVGLDVEQAGARKFATVGGHHGEAFGVEVEEHTVHHGAEGIVGSGEERAVDAREKARGIGAEGRDFAVQLGSEGVFLGVLTHEVVVPVLIGDGDVEVVGVDVEFEGLFGDFLDGLLNGLGVDGEVDGTVALDQLEGGVEGELAVRSRELELVVVDLEEEIVQDGHAVFRRDDATERLETLRKDAAGNGELHIVG